MISFIDYDEENCIDYHFLTLVLYDIDFVYDFDNFGLEPLK